MGILNDLFERLGITPDEPRPMATATTEPLKPTPDFIVAHAYAIRETATYGGADHIVTIRQLDVGRLHRKLGDALCKPKTSFGYLDATERALDDATCKRCREIATRLGILA